MKLCYRWLIVSLPLASVQCHLDETPIGFTTSSSSQITPSPESGPTVAPHMKPSLSPTTSTSAVLEVRAADGTSVEEGVFFVPEVLVRNNGRESWHEICGHWFWNNNYGATAVCNEMGFSYGQLREERWLRRPYDWSGASLRSDALWIGSCQGGDTLSHCTGGENRYDLTEEGCNEAARAGVSVACFEAPPPLLCFSDCDGEPRTCRELITAIQPGSCGSDCDKEIIIQTHNKLQCDFDVNFALVNRPDSLPVRALGVEKVDAGVGFVPEVFLADATGQGSWHEICGHWFWNNHFGATAVCQNFGFPFGRLEKERWTNHDWTGNVLLTDGLHIGSCSRGESLETCSGARNHYDFPAGCLQGEAAGIIVICAEEEFPQPVCAQECTETPGNCEELISLVLPGGCASDCTVEFIWPLYSELGCDFDILDMLNTEPAPESNDLPQRIFPSCLNDCETKPNNCDQAMEIIQPGGCARDCTMDDIEPFYVNMGCHLNIKSDNVATDAKDDLSGLRHTKKRNLRKLNAKKETKKEAMQRRFRESKPFRNFSN